MTQKKFSELIGSIEHGVIDEKITTELAALTAEMQRIARVNGGVPKGKLTISLSFKLEDGAFELRTDTNVKLPPKVNPRVFLFGTKDGGLSEENPRQHSLDLSTSKDVSTGAAGTIRDITDRGRAAANDK